MNRVLLSFLISLLAVTIVSALFALGRQRQIDNSVKSNPVSDADTLVMKEHSGNYSVCKCIGEADEEF